MTQGIKQSIICSISIFPFVSGRSQGSVVVEGRNHSFSSYHVYYCLILTHVVLHLLLDVSVVFQQVV